VSLDFLIPDAPGAVARSPMEREALAAGARMELRDGWNVAASFAGEEAALRDSVGFADHSYLSKFEVNAPHDLELGVAERRDGVWWCPVTRERALVICEPKARPTFEGAIEMTTSYAALTIAGPQARELFARFCALDLRPQSCPPRAFRPGSVARTPGYVLRENGDRFLMLFGWALGRYVWEQVADAAGHLGGGPVGVDALAALPEELIHA
jgi:glycine cleavage system aminomethyltransferase T